MIGSPWWSQMETFSALLTLCAGNSPVTGEFPSQRPVTHSFDVFFDLRLNKRSSKQSRGSWFETSSHSLWRHCNDCAGLAQMTKLFSCMELNFTIRCQYHIREHYIMGSMASEISAGNSPVNGEFPAQMASNAENVSIWWRHHETSVCCRIHTD